MLWVDEKRVKTSIRLWLGLFVKIPLNKKPPPLYQVGIL